MVTITQLQEAWIKFRRFPWPTISFFGLALTVWLLFALIQEYRSHAEDMRQYVKDTKTGAERERALQQQTIQSDQRLIDKFTQEDAAKRQQPQ